MTLYVVRHGETEWNLEERRQGRADSPLTPRGLGQANAAARALHAELGREPGVQLVSSPIGRAYETARIISRQLGVRVEVDPLLAECDLGEWTGLTSPEVEARDPGALKRRASDKWNFRMPGGESYVDLDARSRRWLAEHQLTDGASGAQPRSADGASGVKPRAASRRLAKQGGPGPLVAVTHEMLGRTLWGAFLDLDPPRVLKIRLEHGCVYKLSESGAEELAAAFG